jgi:bacteriocin biosynthesis cyclodehydratase domain-containing protein
MQPFSKPLMPSHFEAWCEPPDASGEEILRIVSAQRSLTLKGRAFREFHRHVIPLLDGQRSFEELCAETADLFDRADLESALSLLASQNIVVEGDNRPTGPARLQPQLNYFHEVAENADEAQRRLAAAHVVVFGLGGAGASVMHALAAAGVGRIAGVDHCAVSAADTYLSPAFSLADVGRPRAEALAARIADTAPEVAANAVTAQLSTEAEVAAAIDGADLVISCLDAGMLNLAFKLNQACHATGVRWISGELSGTDVIAGPAFYGAEGGPCFMCYRMRLVACAGNPQSRFAQERHSDKMKADAGDKRERLVFGAGILANLIGAEALNLLTGHAEPTLGGRLLSFNLTTLTMQKHVVLRKPGCPVCAGWSAG